MEKKIILVSEKEYISDKHIHQAKLGQKINNSIITDIIVVPDWVVELIKSGRIK